MANFSNNAITDSGRALLAHVQMGAVFTPTKITLGSGSLPAGKTARTMTAVVNSIIDLEINKKERSNDGRVVFGGVYNNQEIIADWYFRELALFAKAVYEDGTVIPEVLYSYGNAGSTADVMPAYSSGAVVERQIDLSVYIGNDAVVNMEVDSGLHMTREQAIQLIEENMVIEDSTTKAKYKWGIEKGVAYLEEV